MDATHGRQDVPLYRWGHAPNEQLVFEPAVGVVHCVFSGRLQAESVPSMMAFLEQSIMRARGTGRRLSAYADLLRMTGYEPACREAWQTFMRDHYGDYEFIMCLVHRPEVYLGIRIMKLALGGLIDATRDEAEFRRMLQAAVGGAPAPAPSDRP